MMHRKWDKNESKQWKSKQVSFVWKQKNKLFPGFRENTISFMKMKKKTENRKTADVDKPLIYAAKILSQSKWKERESIECEYKP